MKKRLLCVMAHPDDESLGTGGTLVKCAHENTETFLICATRGERGRFGEEPHPGTEIVGRTREQELLAAAKILQIKETIFLDYMDGDLDKAPPEEVIRKIAFHIRKIKPQVVITFGPEGAYGHPDHVAISQFTLAGIVKAADSNAHINGLPAYAVSKLYHMAWPEAKWQLYQKAFKELSSMVDGNKRMVTPYLDWMITTRVDATAYWKTVWQAIACHKTQMVVYKNLESLPDEAHRTLWGEQEFYRVFSLVNGGRRVETDIFEGVEEGNKDQSGSHWSRNEIAEKRKKV